MALINKEQKVGSRDSVLLGSALLVIMFIHIEIVDYNLFCGAYRIFVFMQKILRAVVFVGSVVAIVLPVTNPG